jgi:hypothetical protein
MALETFRADFRRRQDRQRKARNAEQRVSFLDHN